MSEKNRDNKNRWRNVTIAFRMSPEENAELDLRVGGSFGFVQPEAEFSVNLTNMKSVKVF